MLKTAVAFAFQKHIESCRLLSPPASPRPATAAAVAAAEAAAALLLLLLLLVVLLLVLQRMCRPELLTGTASVAGVGGMLPPVAQATPAPRS